MLSKEEYDGVLKEIAESGGDTPHVLELVERLRDDYDERIGMEREEAREGEYETPQELGYKTAAEVPADMVPRAEYENLRSKYIERFFSSPEEVKEEQTEDVKRDGEKQTFEQLFERKEG